MLTACSLAKPSSYDRGVETIQSVFKTPDNHFYLLGENFDYQLVTDNLSEAQITENLKPLFDPDYPYSRRSNRIRYENKQAVIRIQDCCEWNAEIVKVSNRQDILAKNALPTPMEFSIEGNTSRNKMVVRTAEAIQNAVIFITLPLWIPLLQGLPKG